MIDKAYRWAVPVLGLWLATWILLSSAGVQDDAFIHLRYADNLLRTHLITYDGVHPNYGAYSLLYVYLLAFLRAFTASSNLPRVVSSCAHLLLAAGLLVLFFRSIPRDSSLARLLGLAAAHRFAPFPAACFLPHLLKPKLGRLARIRPHSSSLQNFQS